MLIQWTKWKATAQDKPQMQVWELPERRLQNPALNIGPDALKPITGGPSPRERQMSPLQSSPGPIKAERWLTQNPPMDLVPWIHVVQLPLPTLSPPLPKRISASTYHQQAQSRFGSTLHSHLLSSYIQILPTTWSALARPSVTAKHPQSPQLTAGTETPNQGWRALARGGEDGWGGGEERREGNNLLSQGKKLKLGQILH